MRYITADYIFPVSSLPIPNGIIIVNDEGGIEEVIDPAKSSFAAPLSSIETFKGIICPGFINAHCHLELSHLNGKLSEGKGLPQFIKEIVPNRNASPETIQEAIINAEDEMLTNGIVGVGDICNTNYTFAQKAKGRLRYHNFIELFDADGNRAEEVFSKGKLLADESLSSITRYSLVPHAPYSVSSKLLKLIGDYADANESVLCIHNEETVSENEMFLSGTGELLKVLQSINPFYNDWKATGGGSIAYIAGCLLFKSKTLLVHNTYTNKEDIDFLNRQSSIVNRQSLYWCFCPNANLFIEKRLPDFQLFIDGVCKITIGTDSYASNRSLSILDELKAIQHHSATIPLATLLQWATLNGAEFFGWSKELGCIEKGKSPGLNLIEHADLFKMQLRADSAVKKIL